MAPGEDKNKPNSAPEKVSLDPVDQALRELQDKSLSHGQIVQKLEGLKQDVQSGNQKPLETQRAQSLKEAVRKEVAEGFEGDELSTEEKNTFLNDLDNRVAALETTVQQQEVPQGKVAAMASKAKEKFGEVWDRVKDNVRGIGEFLGVTFPEKAGEAWDFIVKNIWKMLASSQTPFLAKVAQEKVNQTEIFEGMNDFATSSKKINLVVTQADCIKQYKQLAPLIAGFPGTTAYDRATNFLRAYMAKEHPKADSDNKVLVDIDKLVAANVPSNFQVNTPAAAPAVAPAAPPAVAPAAPAASPAGPTPPAATPKA